MRRYTTGLHPGQLGPCEVRQCVSVSVWSYYPRGSHCPESDTHWRPASGRVYVLDRLPTTSNPLARYCYIRREVGKSLVGIVLGVLETHWQNFVLL